MSIAPDRRSTWEPEEIRRVAHRVADMVADYLSGLPDRAVFSPFPMANAERLQTAPPPSSGYSPDRILDEFSDLIAPFPFGNGHPRFWGWINSPPAVMGVFAEMLAAAMNPSVAGGNHAAVHVEHQVLRWMIGVLGLPPSAGGLLVSGGSMANLTALAAARHVKAGFDVRARGLQRGDAELTVYMSSEGHGCIRKAVELLGLGYESLRVIPVDQDWRMNVDALAAAIDADVRAGRRPIAVAASAGTVNTGAVDPLEAVAAVCRERDVWFHVDGAYGAAAVLSREADRVRGLALADSVALDPHKWLYVPVEAGLVLVRHANDLRSAFSLVPPYLRTDGDPHGVGGPPWFSEFGFQQSRGFRALKMWMALSYYGTDGYTAAHNHDLELAAYLAECVARDPDLELAAPRSLGIVCFRYVPAAGYAGVGSANDDERLNMLNRRVLERLQLSGRAFVSSTVLNNRFVLRACIVNPLSAQEDIDVLLASVKEFGGELA